jgi:hypothetical protein
MIPVRKIEERRHPSLPCQPRRRGAQMVQENVGQVTTQNSTLQLTDGPGSVRAGPLPVQQVATLAPGDTGAVTPTLDKDLPDGPWTPTDRLGLSPEIQWRQRGWGRAQSAGRAEPTPPLG